MKILATIFAVCFSSAAFSAVQVSPGNELVSECDLPSRGEDFRTVGTLSSASGRSVKKEITAVGKEIKQGDAVYYVQLEKSKIYYTSPKQIEIKDQSPLTPDAIAEANKKIWGVCLLHLQKDGGAVYSSWGRRSRWSHCNEVKWKALLSSHPVGQQWNAPRWFATSIPRPQCSIPKD